MKAEDGKLYAEITLRDVVEKNDVSDMPLLAEVKRLYDENAKLREFAALAWQIMTRNEPLYVWQGMVDDAHELGIEEES